MWRAGYTNVDGLKLPFVPKQKNGSQMTPVSHPFKPQAVSWTPAINKPNCSRVASLRSTVATI